MRSSLAPSPLQSAHSSGRRSALSTALQLAHNVIRLRPLLLSVGWSAVLIASVTTGQQLLAVVLALMVPPTVFVLTFGTTRRSGGIAPAAIQTWLTVLGVALLIALTVFILLETL